MRVYKSGIIYSILISLISIAIAIVFHYLNIDFISNIFIGVFSSALLVIITSIIGYNVEKNKELMKYINISNCLSLYILPLYNLLRKDNYTERNFELEFGIIKNCYNFMMENVHMKIDNISFIYSKCKMAKQINDISEMILDVYVKIIQLYKVGCQHQMGVASFKDWDEYFSPFVSYIRDCGGDRLYTSVLLEKQAELQDMAKIKFTTTANLNYM